jgi:hypothetical protein
MSEVKGFKVFNPDWTCRGFQYEVGKTFEEDVEPEVCERGFHFCKNPANCFSYYDFDSDNKVAEVIALGDIDEICGKCCTNKIKIVREISWEEVLALVNTGIDNTGLGNSGNGNSGNRNSGDYNSGYHNSGNYNSGNKNSGHSNSGHWNSGYCNSGDCNSGDNNSGNYNSGDFNNGSFNSGGCNIGSYNTGHFNIGDFNTGDFNTSSYGVGCFCTKKNKMKFFDKESDMTFEKWRNSEAYCILYKLHLNIIQWNYQNEMTDEEKEEHPEYATTGGYLKKQEISDCYNEWWNNLTKEEKEIIKEIPNFDSEKFFKITGIRV